MIIWLWTNFNRLHQRMFCAKFCWNLPSRSGVKMKMWKVYNNDNANNNGGQRTNCGQKSSLSLRLRWAKKLEKMLFCKSNEIPVAVREKVREACHKRKKSELGRLFRILRTTIVSIVNSNSQYELHDRWRTLRFGSKVVEMQKYFKWKER